MSHQTLPKASNLLLLRQNQPNPNTSSGICFFASESQAGSNFIPCGNSAFGHQTCCQAGDNCISANACFNYRDRITYLAGCTDSSYSSPSCPGKGQYGDQQWSGLVQCDSRAGTWTNCQESPGAVNVGDANPNCKCNGKPPLFTASSYLAPIAQLPFATGGTISWYSGHTPPSGLTPTAGPSSTTTRRPSSTTTTPPSATTTSIPSSSGGVSSTTAQDNDGISSQPQSTTPPPDTTTAASPSSSATDAAGAGAGAATGSESSTTSSDGLSTGGKIGVGVGVSAGALILIALLVFCFMTMRKKRRQAEFYDESNQPYSVTNGDRGGGGGSGVPGGQGQYMPPMSFHPSAMPGSAGRGSEHGGFGAPSTAAAVGAAGVAAMAAGRKSQDSGRRPSWDQRYQGQQGQYAQERPSGGGNGYAQEGYGAAAGAAGAVAGRRSQDTVRRPSTDRNLAQQPQYGDQLSDGRVGYSNTAYGAGAGAGAGATAGAMAAAGRRSSDRGRRPSQDNTQRPNWEPHPPTSQRTHHHAPPPSSFYNRQRQTQWPAPAGSAAATWNTGSERPANETVAVSPVGSPVGNNTMRPPSPSPPSSYDYPQHGTNLYVVNPDPSSRSSAQTGHAGVAARAMGKQPSDRFYNTEEHAVGPGAVGEESINVGRRRRQDLLYQGQYQEYHQQAPTPAAVQPQRAEWGYGRSRGQEGLYTGPGGGGRGDTGRGGIRIVRKSVPDRTGR